MLALDGVPARRRGDSAAPSPAIPLSLFLIFLLSGVNLEGNVGTSAEELEPGAKEYVQLLLFEKCALEELPLVTKVSLFGGGSILNKTGVRISLNTEFIGVKKRRQLNEHCCEGPTDHNPHAQAKPT